MIRTLLTGLVVALAVLLGLPWLILWTLATGRPGLMYRLSMRFSRFADRLAGMRVRVEGLGNIPPCACIFAANHASSLDPFALMPVIPRRVAIFAKRELFRIPIFSAGMRLAGFIRVDRSGREAAASIATAVRRLKEGLSLAIFPEGTRSPDGCLRRFRKGAFAMAIEAGVPIVPVSIAGTHRVLRRGDWVVHPGEVTVRFAPAVDASSYAASDRSTLLARVESLVAAGLPADQQPLPARSPE
ncbi:MAG: lysophospholipid acyltransferase family protein [Candidatus Acidiferrales bacterium]|jgi:1-acyl-sn-glycerol-3-phosphate acyltransferase